MVELSEIKRSLQSSTVKHRKEAVKQLEIQLQSPFFLRQLDVNTVKLWPEDKIQLVSWPGLVDTYLNYMHKEVAENKRQLDAAALKVFKSIFSAADSAERCGAGRNNLLRRAGAAFDKFGKMLELSPLGQGLATPLGKEIASVLLKVLLPNPAYCQRGTVDAFQGLLEEAMLRFEALQQQVEESAAAAAQQAATATAAGRLAAGGRGSSITAAAVQQDLFGTANLVAGLLAGVPGQMSGPFVVDMLAFLTQALSWLDKQGDYGRVCRQLTASLNGLLLTYGSDLRPQLPTTHKALRSYVKHAWTAHTNVPVKEGVLCYCRLSVALHGAQAVGTSLSDLLSMVTRDINAPGFTWDLHGTRQHQQLAPLAASLYYHAAFDSAAATASASSTAAAAAASSGRAAAAPAAGAAPEVGSCGSNGAAVQDAHGGLKRRSSTADAGDAVAAAAEGDSDDELLQLPRKRSRVMGPAGQLLVFLQTDPERWGPVVALMLHQHGSLLPAAFMAALQHQLAVSTARCLAAAQQVLQPTTAATAGAGAADRHSASPAAAGEAAGTVAAAAAAAAAGSGQHFQQLLWLSRCLCELASCWPAALHPSNAAASLGCGVGGYGSPDAGAAGNTTAVHGTLGPAYDASEGCCSKQPWTPAEAASARTSCSSSWQQLWNGCVGMLASSAAAAELKATQPVLLDGMAWLLHVLLALKLVHVPSKAASLLLLQGLWVPQHEQQGMGPTGDADGNDQQQPQHHQQQVVLSNAQLALLLSLCLGQRISSHKEMLLRQQLFEACLSTAAIYSSSSHHWRSSRHASGNRASAAGGYLPDLLLPAILALIGAPDLPTPSLNGAPAAMTAASAARATLASVQRSWSVMPDTQAGPGTAAVTAAAAGSSAAGIPLHGGNGVDGAADAVWYAAGEAWWWADPQLEAQLAGLELGLDTLRRQLAEQQLRQVLAAAASAGTEGSPAVEAVMAGVEGCEGSDWWRCFCRLADEVAEQLCNALLPFTPAGQEEEQGHLWGPSQETVAAAGVAAGDGSGGGAAAAAADVDPVSKLCYLLLLLNASVSLPCVAAVLRQQHVQQQQQLALDQQRRQQSGSEQQQDQRQQKDQMKGIEQEQQQRQQQEGMFCGFGFSRHPQQHQQLQQMVMEAGIKAGQLLADNLQQLPCDAGSCWLQMLMHLGGSLARIQALMVELPIAEGPDTCKIKYQMLAAASFLAEVVKVLERVTTQAADTATAELDEQMGGAGATGDQDLDDDFMDTAPVRSRPGAHAATQQQGFAMPAASTLSAPAASFRPTQAGPSVTGGRAPAGPAAGPAGTAAGSGPAVFVGGGLAGFSGRAAAGLGNPSAVVSPALLPQHSMYLQTARGHEAAAGLPGFAVGGLGEGLSGLAGVEGAALRVFAALSPAYADTAQALMRLWMHLAGLTGWAPPETLLQAVVETATTAVCAGGWSHLPQLFGLMKGSHTLLSAQKVPTSTSHLILRLLQQVAVAAAAAGLRLDVPCALPESQQASQEGGVLPSQEQRGHKQQGTTFLSLMLEICSDVQRRLGIKHGAAEAESHLPLSTQLQLGLTTLALLQLQPHASYSCSHAAAVGTLTGPSSHAQHTEAVTAWRQRCLLALLSSPSSALRVRAGPLAAALLTSVATASAVAVIAASDQDAADSNSVAELIKTALADISGYLFLQDSAELTQAQTARVQKCAAAMQLMSAPGAAGSNARMEVDAASREAQQDAIAWESAVVQLVQMAAATPAAACVALQQQEPPDVLDAQLLVLLLRHTASLQLLPTEVLPAHSSSGSGDGVQIRAMQVAAVGLDVLAAQQQYDSRYAHLHYHRRAWVKEWVGAGCSVQQLLAVQGLICPGGVSRPLLSGSNPAAAQATAGPAQHAQGGAGGVVAEGSGLAQELLQSYGSSLIFWMIFFGAHAELTALAAAAGLAETELLQMFTHELCSLVYPVLKVPELKQQETRFRHKLPANAQNLSQDDSVALVFSLFENSLPVLPPTGVLQQHATPAAPSLEITLPFITQTAADRGLEMIAKVCKGSSWLTVLPFNPAGIQALLLMVHRSVVSAAHPLHKLQCMGQFQCLLRQLPSEQLRSPAVARSLVSMLLQQLRVPGLQGICCSCLQQLFAGLLAAVPAHSAQPGSAAAPAPHDGKKASKQQQQQAHQQQHEELTAALIQELLRPTVAALVQCVEEAAAALQAQQQLSQWAPLLSNAAAGLGRGRGQQALDLPSTWAPVALLLSLLKSQFLQDRSLLLDLLPPLPVLSAAADKQQWYQGSLVVLVPWIAERAANMTASSRYRAMQHLIAKLHREGAGQLYVSAASMQPQQQSHTGGISGISGSGRVTASQAAMASDADSAVVHRGVAAAAFKLARLGAELCDAAVMQLAAELLAAVGPLDPDVITLDYSTTAQAAAGGSNSSSSSSHSDRTAFPLRAVLELLAQNLFDPEPRVVETAQHTLCALVAELDSSVLQQVLQPRSGAAGTAAVVSTSEAAAAAGLLLQSYVSVYTVSHLGTSSNAGSNATAAATAAALEAAASVQLWSAADKPYKQWLCRLSSTLLRACGAVTDTAAATRRSSRTSTAAASIHVSAGLLQQLADAAGMNPHIAELLLPHAVLKLCESDSSGADIPGAGSVGWAARLGAAATAGLQLNSLAGAAGGPWAAAAASAETDGLFTPVGSAAAATTGGVDARCYSVLLSCLEHNRSVQRMALMCLPCDPTPAATAWHRCFCLHLDYLQVAAAAMAVKAYFTALLYIEQWCAEARQAQLNPFEGAVADSGLLQLQQLAGMGSTSSSNSGAADGVSAVQQTMQQQQQLLEQLLLEVYSNVNEPDGVYALSAAFGSSASQLQVLQHEQQWAAVLGGQDALLQAAVLQQPQQQQSKNMHLAGALTALQRLGCQATAQQCISGALLQQRQKQQQQKQQHVLLPPGLPQHVQRQQQQQQLHHLLEAQHELAWRLSDWGLADSLSPHGVQLGPVGMAAAAAAAPAAPASLTWLTAQGNQQEAHQQGFHAAVLSALTALQHKDYESFALRISSSQRDRVLQLARSSTQSAAAVNPLLVQLQMLQMLSQSLTAAKSCAAEAAGATDWSVQATQELLAGLLGSQLTADNAPQAAAKLCTVSFHLSDQLLSLQAALTKALHRPDALLATLQASMRMARRAGQVNFAAAALQQLQETLHQAVLSSRATTAWGLPAALGVNLQSASGAGTSSQGLKLPVWLQAAVAADAQWPLEAVKLRWLQGQHQAALRELQSLATGLQSQLPDEFSVGSSSQQQQRAGTSGSKQQDSNAAVCALMQARMLLGKWLTAGEGSISNIQDAMVELRKAVQLAPLYKQQTGSVTQDMLQLHSRVCYQLAICADQHYQMLDAQLTSPEFQKQLQVLRTKEQLLQQLSEAVEATKHFQRLPAAKQQSAKAAYVPVARRFAETQRQVKLDQQAVKQLQHARMQYLASALTAYRDCIAAGAKHDLQAVYRMCGLWFRHSDDNMVNSLMNNTFQMSVPTAKFIPLVYQIASRMDNSNSEFQVVLTSALYRMAQDHPFHTLYSVIALSNGDTESGDPAAKNAHIKHMTNTGKVVAAKALLQKLQALDPLKPIVDDMMAQVADLIAMTLQVHKSLPRDARGSLAVDQYTMPANFRRRLKSLRNAPPICFSLPLDTTRRYEDVPYVVEIDSIIKIAGGINTPLIVRTTDDRGHVQRQLCKCNDDLRQDAVMQQFFGLVDTLLGDSPASRQRRLGVRTYRVVPCSPLVGVLEWVEGTLPLTEYLLGDRNTNYAGGACARYHGHESLSWLECYLKMDKALSQPDQLKDTFTLCCKSFPPVFRHFFLEAFLHPADWFEARTRYTRSTAVASMAGAVIGLGDRHLGNILLDMHTAEVVHIDLGIAFEQGLFLQTPERVPFRLTANIVDGMGAAGVEGPYRRCCETALQVLREHQDALLTVVQVVLHDPLYRWQMTPIKAGRKQLDPMAADGQQQEEQQPAAPSSAATADAAASDAGAGASSGALGNADAERAVLRVKQKLQGQDVEGGASLSVAAQVAALLQSAQDPDNLCRMFKGWAPWV